jgi:hypothetical protein
LPGTILTGVINKNDFQRTRVCSRSFARQSRTS